MVLKREDQIDEAMNDRFNLAKSEQSYSNSLDTPSNTEQQSADSTRDIQQREESTDSTPWVNKWNGSRDKQSSQGPQYLSSRAKTTTGKAFSALKSRKGITGSIIGLLIALVTGGGFFMSGNMLGSLYSQLLDHGDSTSTAFSRRIQKVFGQAGEQNPLCTSNIKSFKCRFGRISNKALYKLDGKGVRAVFEDGTEYSKDLKSGYTEKKVVGYKFVDADGNGQTKSLAELNKYLGSNFADASKVYGVRGALNVKFQSWTGKYTLKNFINKYKVNLKGGLADGSNTDSEKKTVKDRLDAFRERAREKLPAADTADAMGDKIKTKLEDKKKGISKAGAVYMAAFAGCMVTKAPKIISAAVAGFQLVRILPMVNDYILSPGSKQMASGVDTKNSISSDDVEMIGGLLTERTKDSDGKMTSALDSPTLLSALGVNTAKTGVPKDFAPGYGIINSDAYKAGVSVQDGTEGVCNVIMSPVAMWTAFSVDAALTVGTGGIGGIIKVVGSLAVGVAIDQGINAITQFAAPKLLEEVATNKKLETASGKALGDALGVSALSFFSAGGMAHHLPALSESQLVSYERVKQQDDSYIAKINSVGVSPFDLSNRYSFASTLVSSFQKSMLGSGYYGTLLAAPAALAQLPLTAFVPKTYAETTKNECSYASDYGLIVEDDPSRTPAINAAGLPCTGITSTQASMSTQDAIDLLINEKWLDESKLEGLSDSADISELVSSGAIVADTPLATYISSCGDASGGDYITDSAGCIMPGDTASVESKAGSVDISGMSDQGSRELGEVSDPRSYQAIPVFLMDYQIVQSMNGEDDGFTNPTAQANDSPGADAETIDGSAKDLAQQILDNPNITYWDQARDAGDQSRPSDNLRSIAKGELAHTSKRGPAKGATTAIDVNLLKFIAELGSKRKIMINAIAGQVHSANSNHYKGLAVDFNCGDDIPQTADAIGKKYGVGKNYETCAKDSHWHYEVGR